MSSDRFYHEAIAFSGLEMWNRGQMGALAKLVQKDAQLQKFLKDFQR